MKEIILLRVILNETEPVIWRDLAVRADSSFSELHHTIQLAMSWADRFRYEFNIEGYRIGWVNKDMITEAESADDLLNADTTLLRDIISSEEETFVYIYDPEKNWEHTIEVLSFMDPDPNYNCPFCFDGEMAGPREEDFLDAEHYCCMINVLQDESDPQHEFARSWFQEQFDPTALDIQEINEVLNELVVYIKHWRRRNQ